MPSTSGLVRPVKRARSLRHHLRSACGSARNPLCRPLDRARSRALLLAALALVVAALAGTGVALTDLAAGQRGAALAAAHRHRLDAVLLAPAYQVAGLPDGITRARYQAFAEWTAPSGQRVSDTVDVDRPTSTGTVTRIWVNDDGRPAAAPPGAVDVTAHGAFLGLFVLAALAALTGALLGIRLRALDRRADRLWQHSWTRLEPLWTGRTAH
ncbi:Rv1733c family protein [Kitasatospora sp. NPDC001159]